MVNVTTYWARKGEAHMNTIQDEEITGLHPHDAWLCLLQSDPVLWSVHYNSVMISYPIMNYLKLTIIPVRLMTNVWITVVMNWNLLPNICL